MRYIKSAGALLVMLIFSFGTVYAQATANKNQNQPKPVDPSSITNQELQTFIKASNDIQAIQMGSMQKIKSAVTNNGMSLMRFRQIMMSKRNPQQDTLKMSSKEQKEFSKIRQNIIQIETKVNKQIVAKVKSDNMKISRYKQIYTALQHSKALQKRVKSLAQKQ